MLCIDQCSFLIKIRIVINEMEWKMKIIINQFEAQKKEYKGREECFGDLWEMCGKLVPQVLTVTVPLGCNQIISFHQQLPKKLV